MEKPKLTRICLLLALLGCGPTAMAQQNFLCLYSRNQAKDNSWSIERVRKLTFSETDVSVFLHDGDVPYTLPYDNLRKLTFEADPITTDIEKPEATATTALRYDATQRSLFVGSETDGGLLQVYRANGTLVWQSRLIADRQVYPLEGLSDGLYIARLADGIRQETLKFIIK